MSHLVILYFGSLMCRSLCLGVVGLLGTFFLRNVAKRHAVWCAVLGAMLLMPILDVIVPRSVISLPIQRIEALQGPATDFPSTGFVLEPSHAGSGGSIALKASKEPNFWAFGLALYASVAMLLLFRLAWALRTVSHLKAASRKISHPVLSEVGGPNTPAVFESDAVHVPLAGGLRSAFVLLPGSWKAWDEWKLRAVLSHEFTHIRRADPLISMIAAINTSVFWFNPLSWFVERTLSSLSERASDEASVLRNGDPPRYAQVLLQFARSAQKRGRVGLTSVAMAKRSIRSRVETVLNMRSPRNGIVTKAGWITTAIVAFPIVYAASALHIAPSVAEGQSAQSPTEPLKFEVASIKSDPGCTTRPRTGQTVSLGRMTLECFTLQELVEFAYGVWADAANPNPKHPDVRGGPGWVNSDHYTIATTATGNPSRGEMNGPMLRNLLEERFALQVHRESEVVPVYALTLANGRVKPKPAQDGRCVRSNPTQIPPPPAPGEPPLPVCGRPIPSPKGRNVAFDVLGVSIADFADAFLSRIMNRVVIDKTGETGFFDLHFEFTPNDATPLGGPPLPVSPAGENDVSIFTALEQQLGLKLENDKAPVAMLVIESVSKPSEN